MAEIRHVVLSNKLYDPVAPKKRYTSCAAAEVDNLRDEYGPFTTPAATTWAQYLMGFARHAATKSKDSTKVGAILVGPEGEVRLSAYNGPPRGVEDRSERFERPAKYLYASHAEANLIAFAAREGIRTQGCTVYVTHQPCAACSRTLIQAGIAALIYGEGSFANAATWDGEIAAATAMFREAGVRCEAVG